jgi:tRNA A-37 threonylcarbamoyl transferase component Bud32
LQDNIHNDVYEIQVNSKKYIWKEDITEEELKYAVTAGERGIGPKVLATDVLKPFYCKMKMIMEKINGVTLYEYIRNAKFLSKPKEERLGIMKELMSKIKKQFINLAFMGILHNDLHCQNIFVLHDNSVLLIDFGVFLYTEDYTDITKTTPETFFEDRFPCVCYDHEDLPKYF